jgi:phosphatidylserine/phosphatidylglycerophosphate/cardiolipin synthase-like enzyme
MKKLCLIIIPCLLLVGCSSTKTYSAKKVEKNVKVITANTESSTSSNIQYYFSNEGTKPDTELINLINSSNKTLDIAIYSLTKADIVNAIIQAKTRGVNVRLMSDRECSQNRYQKVELEKIKNAGIPIKINTHSGLLHDKYTVVDGSIVATGSNNYTNATTDENDENFIVIKDSNVAKGYDDNFSSMWNDTTRFENY